MHHPFQFKPGISGKIAMLVCSIAILSVVLTNGWGFYRFDQVLLKENLKSIEHDSHVASERLLSHIRSMTQDARFLHDTPPIQGIVRAKAHGGVDSQDGSTIDQWQDRLNTIFKGMIQAKPSYRQIRLIGVANNGREMVRVDRIVPGDEIKVIPTSEMQSKSHRDFFKEILKFQPDSVYLSEINLNWDYGKIVEPHLPVLRAAIKVLDEQGDTFGFVIINMDMRYVFEELENNFHGPVDFMMTNADGDFLVHPDHAKTFGFDLKQDYRLQKEFPELASRFDSEQTQHWTGIIDQQPPAHSSLATSLHKVYFDSNSPQRFICLVLSMPRDKILQAMRPLHNQILVVSAGLLLLTLIIGLFYSRSLTRPLMQIIQAIDSYGKGETRSIHIHKAPVDETGILLHAFQNMVIKVEKRNNELRFSEARNRAVLEAAADAILTIDEMGVIQSVNSATEKLFGYTVDDLIGHRIEKLMPSPHRENHDGYLSRHRDRTQNDATSGEGVIGRIREISGLRSDGTVFPMELSVSRVWINNRQLFTGIIRDVTERKESEAHLIAKNIELEQKNKEAEQFTYSVSHDLKSPLVSCTGLMALVWEDMKTNNMEGVRDSLERIDRNVRRMEGCINDLLEFCRVGRVRHEPVWIDMNELVAGVVHDLDLAIKHADVIVEVQPNLPKLYADASRMMELFVNLLDNALKYGCENASIGKIEIGAIQQDNQTLFFVRDYGQGIDPIYHRKIFALFQRLSKDRQGSGVGLAIVARIMEIHNGKAWVESEVGQGATFWLAFGETSCDDAAGQDRESKA